MLISIETYIICDFPGGGGGWSGPPLWIRTLDRQLVKGQGAREMWVIFEREDTISPISYLNTQ